MEKDKGNYTRKKHKGEFTRKKDKGKPLEKDKRKFTNGEG